MALIAVESGNSRAAAHLREATQSGLTRVSVIEILKT